MNIAPLKYDFIAPRQIVFGWGRRRELGTLTASLGPRAFVVTGSQTLERNGVWQEISDSLTSAGIKPCHAARINREPLTSDVDALVQTLRDADAGPGDWVLAIGGGSAIDLAKAAAALATQPTHAPVSDYLEGVGRGLKLTAAPLPFVAMPTTGGTGAEATKNAVISSLDPSYKKSLRANSMVAALVIVDPELGVSVPANTTAWAGLDAITQLIESYITRNAQPLTDALCVEGLCRAWPALRIAVSDGADRPAREALAHAALLSGMALANSGLGLAHGVAAALGLSAQVPHGLACAVMLPSALRVNRLVCEAKLATLARATQITDSRNDALAAEALVAAVETLCHDLGVPPRLRDLGVRNDQLPALVKGSRGNSMNGNPRDLSDAELFDLLEALW